MLAVNLFLVLIISNFESIDSFVRMLELEHTKKVIGQVFKLEHSDKLIDGTKTVGTGCSVPCQKTFLLRSLDYIMISLHTHGYIFDVYTIRWSS